MIDSTTIASETPAQASQSDNVRKCPVLSGPTDPDDETDASPDNHKTCERTPSCPDQTSTAPEPFAVPQQDQTPESDIHPKDDAVALTSTLREIFVGDLPQDLTADEQRDLQGQDATASPQPTTA